MGVRVTLEEGGVGAEAGHCGDCAGVAGLRPRLLTSAALAAANFA